MAQPELIAEHSQSRPLPHDATRLGRHGCNTADLCRPLSAIPSAAAKRSSRVPLATHLRHTEHLEWCVPPFIAAVRPP